MIKKLNQVVNRNATKKRRNGKKWEKVEDEIKYMKKEKTTCVCMKSKKGKQHKRKA